MTAEDTGPDVGAPVGAWTELVRRPVKATALAFASYANADGTGIHCGIARLAADCEIGYSTAGRHVRFLRSLGLTEVTRPGNRRTGRADEYRLIFAVDLVERLEAHGVVLPSPEEYRDLIGQIRETNRRQSADRQRRARQRRLHSPNARSTLGPPSVETGPGQDPSTLTRPSVETGDLRSPGTAIYAHPGDPPPSLEHPPSWDLPCVTADPGRQPQGVARAREATAPGAPDKPRPLPECPQCGVVLDPGGACFMCAGGRHATGRSMTA